MGKAIRLILSLFLVSTNIWGAIYYGMLVENTDIREGALFNNSDLAIFYLDYYLWISIGFAAVSFYWLIVLVKKSKAQKTQFVVLSTLSILFVLLVVLNEYSNTEITMPLAGMLSYSWTIKILISTSLIYMLIIEIKNTFPNKGYSSAGKVTTGKTPAKP